MKSKNKEQNRNSARSRVIQSKLLAKSWRVRFLEDTVMMPSGKTYLFPRFEIPEFVIAVAKRSDGRIPLVRQYRRGAKALFWELPAGLVEPKEKLIDSVEREFREETGFEFREPRLIASVFSTPGRTNEKAHIFIGKVGKEIGKQQLDDNERLEVRFVRIDDAFRLLKNRISSTMLLAYLLAREVQAL